MSSPATNGLTLDAGALVAIERGDRRVNALLRRAQQQGLAIHVPAGVAAQTWRGGARQALLAKILLSDDVDVVPLDAGTALEVGVLCGTSGHSDVLDVHVAIHAARQGHRVVTSDPDDIARVDPSLELVVV